METIRGRKSLELDLNGLMDRLAKYNRITLDLGTGDGRYVRTLAGAHPDWFIIGVDSCRENLREYSQVKLQNMLFVIASAQDLPNEFNGLISHLTINFPWGSLLKSLFINDSDLMSRLSSISRPNAQIDIHLNTGALAEVKSALEDGAMKIQENLVSAGWQIRGPVLMNARDLKNFSTTWARRLAHGRDPQAMILRGCLK